MAYVLPVNRPLLAKSIGESMKIRRAVAVIATVSALSAAMAYSLQTMGSESLFDVVVGNPPPTASIAPALTTAGLVLPSSLTIPEQGDATKGTFSDVLNWPLVGIHSVLLPDGRVLSYGTDANGVQTGKFIYDVWDPLLGTGVESHNTLPNQTLVDVFCSAQLVLPEEDNVQIFGGDVTDGDGQSNNVANSDVTLFRLGDNTLTRTGAMNRKRWYATATTLPSGEIFLQGGLDGQDRPEVRQVDGKFRLMSGIDTNNLSWFYPRNFVGPDGNVFGFSGDKMYRMRPLGNGVMESLGVYPGGNTGNPTTAVMFEASKILQLAGGADAANAHGSAYVIDIAAGAPKVTPTESLKRVRHWSTATVLPDGKVFVSGGAKYDASVYKATGYYPDGDVAYTSELYDPGTGKWTDGATAKRMRLYHSTSLLLPNGSVLTMGGGAPGPQTNLNAEIYYPPYLFTADGKRAPRPSIASAPMTATAGTSIAIGTPDAAKIQKVVLVKTGSVTHSFDMDQRRVELSFSLDGDGLKAQLPEQESLTPPGQYMVFLIDQAGVPSHADILRIEARPMTRAYNVYGLYKEGANVLGGGLDGSNNAYSSDLLGKSVDWNGSHFILGPANGPSAASNTTIRLTKGKYAKLNVLAAAVYGDQPSQTFVVNYVDGTIATFTQGVTDWYHSPHFKEPEAVSMPAHVKSDGSRNEGHFRLFGYQFALDPTKDVASLTLPANDKVRVLGVEGAP